MEQVFVIIVAAGKGLRFGSELPKQYCNLLGKPVLIHTINRFRESIPSAKILLVINRDAEDLWKKICDEHKFVSPAIVYGGNSRLESVGNAIKAIESDEGVVLIHDAVRPLVTHSIITAVIEGTRTADGVIPVVPVTDSLREKTGASGKTVSVDRSNFMSVQTPQGFPLRLFREAYGKQLSPALTDDASVMDAAGYEISTVCGDPVNIKITNPLDLAVAQAIMESAK